MKTYMMSLEEYDREVARRLFRRRLRTFCEIVGGIAGFGLIWATCWLGCYAFD